ncbi:RNA-dependent ATPase rok1 [Mycoblastus sanguinarius]|nr:RNA-dependent ATPase rok1 [Mycoblastus sanguinarius]
MDMFKLLVRSTNLQKSVPPSTKSSIHNVPSAGYDSSHDRVHPEDGALPHVHEELRHRGTKRKRADARRDQGHNIPEQLNLFGVENRNAASLPGVAGGNTTQPDILQEEAKVHSTGSKEPVLSEEEYRQHLKKHKVKITLLKTAHEVGDKQQAQPTRPGLTESSRKKNTQTQISTQPLTSFRQLRGRYGISKRLAENIDGQGYLDPTEVQLGSLPILLGSDDDRGLQKDGGKKSNGDLRSEIDMLAVAPTGSGKTLAFMIHVLHGLLKHRGTKKAVGPGKRTGHEVQALILAPTHELMDQIVNEGRKMALGTGIKVSGMKKGMRLHLETPDLDGHNNGDIKERTKYRHTEEPPSSVQSLVKADVLVSTPLLLLHAISSTSDLRSTPLASVRFLVLDEADVLLDPLFREQTLGVWSACNNRYLRVSLWSATIGSSIETLAQSFILDRRQILHLDSTTSAHHIVRVVIGLKDSAIPNISHRLIYAASEQGKLLALRQLLHPSAAPTSSTQSLQPPFLIFTQTISRAIALHSELLYDIPLEAGGSSRIAVLHLDLSETARSNTMAGFRKGEIWILITTDLLSRGMDFRGMNGVVNYDIPNTGASYVHRAGRTGRQGRQGGVAVTLYTKEDIPYVKNVANVIAASERTKGETAVGDGNESVQKWLLDALPNVGKKTKRELRNKGVESRRPVLECDRREARKMRISTKSGYERRLQNKMKGAVKGSQRRVARDTSEPKGSKEEEWGGIND